MKYLISFLLLIVLSINVKAQVDPNFFIFLCFGQSNMEGAAVPEAIDEEYVDERFQTLACENFYTLGRTMGEWYTAYPPIVRENTNIGMADYFGRTMVAALPAECRVGVVDVAVGGVGITAFMPENAADWAWIMNNTYNNDPYTRLVQMAKVAQESGVIKGILLHQGERDCGEYDWQNYWPEYVKIVYENLLTDLGLSASEVPLLVGEVVAASEKGVFSAHNPVIATVPSVIPTAHVISAEGCPSQSDHMHFALPGYRLMGKRYALKMLSLMGYPTCMDAFYQLPDNLYPFYKATSISSFEDISLEPGEFMSIDVTASFADEHVENVTANVDICCTGDGVQIVGNQLTCVSEASTLVTISYTDFIGETVSTSFYVNKSDEPEEIVVIGDVNGDEVLDDNDLKAVVDYIMGRTPEGLFDPDKANLNHDEDVNVADVVLLFNLMGQQNAVNE